MSEVDLETPCCRPVYTRWTHICCSTRPTARFFLFPVSSFLPLPFDLGILANKACYIVSSDFAVIPRPSYQMAPASSKLASFFVSLSSSETFTVFVIAIVSFPLLRLAGKIWHTSSSPLRVLRGPKPKSLGLFGNLKEIRSLDYGIWHEQVIKEHGPVMAYKGFMGVSTCDFFT